MRTISIQNTNIVNIIKNTGIYVNNTLDGVPLHMIKSYEFMIRHYRYEHRPIFMCPVGYNCNFGGADISNSIILEMDIPDRFCKIQDYYGWSDFIYFKEMPGDYEPFNGLKTVDDFGKFTLDLFNKQGLIKDKNIVYQVTTQMIRKCWVRKAIPLNQEFIDRYVDTGGVNILQSII